ncbi:hypothetical protein SISNIDRAFT_511576 [Sistotremastrum niveocremeum HHB9708]|uniref:Uncharacterized protein n=1 Tax=Sistotremastrum niveocremeum HHB9708 TaxID=1314777 RepID=A0A164T6K4_9AGAM|nr:hypothetical protein SISNIDRAFT_511576 [Sistotremastrum niveocremeum HHB9708]
MMRCSGVSESDRTYDVELEVSAMVPPSTTPTPTSGSLEKVNALSARTNPFTNKRTTTLVLSCSVTASPMDYPDVSESESEISLASGLSGIHWEPASQVRTDPGFGVFGRRGLGLAQSPYNPYTYDPNYLPDLEATFDTPSTDPCQLVPTQTVDYSRKYVDCSPPSAEPFAARKSGLLSDPTIQNHSTPGNQSYVDRVVAGRNGKRLPSYPFRPSPDHLDNEGTLPGANGGGLGSQHSSFYSDSSPTAQVGVSRHYLQSGEGQIIRGHQLPSSQDESPDGPIIQFSHNLRPPPLAPTRASRSIRTAFPQPASGSSTRSHRMRPEYQSPEREGRNRTTVDPGARYRKKIEVGLEELAEALETVGMGIHGEKGSMKILVLRKAKEVVLSYGSLTHTQSDQPPG